MKTTVGRRNLFCYLARDRPEHIWISPTCGPWCQWSNLNMSKSAELRDKILQHRKENIWQVSLSQVLCEIQLSQRRHFHCEQPQGSQMFKLPCFQKIVAVTKPSIFDLCRVGRLREPVTDAPIRKRLVVRTTSQRLHENLHNRKCTEPREQQEILRRKVKACHCPDSRSYTQGSSLGRSSNVSEVNRANQVRTSQPMLMNIQQNVVGLTRKVA